DRRDVPQDPSHLGARGQVVQPHLSALPLPRSAQSDLTAVRAEVEKREGPFGVVLQEVEVSSTPGALLFQNRDLALPVPDLDALLEDALALRWLQIPGGQEAAIGAEA